MREAETICALSTPPGSGGIAVIRLSGSRSREILNTVFFLHKNEAMEERKLYYGLLKDQDNTIDEIMAVYFCAPKSYTGEDMAEFHCHGGSLPVRRALDLLIRNGARMAAPGEFTKRAFLNGKMDLSRAEAVMSYISALSESGAKAALNQMEGALYRKITALQDRLTDTLAKIEAVIEYPEEDFNPDMEKEILAALMDCKDELLSMTMTFDGGRILQEGYKVVIAGRPNVGKSSLLNNLLQRERAIVTDIPGTTRDILEEVVSIKGIPVRFLDTAGIRETSDLVENIGVKRSHDALNKSDMILLVLDLSEPISNEDLDIYNTYKNHNLLIVLNKTDIRKTPDSKEVPEEFLDKDCLFVSALTGDGIEQLNDEIYKRAVKDESVLEGVVITSARHKDILFQAAKNLTDATDAYWQGLSMDCLTIDIKSAWNTLGEITGVTVTEEIINRIFEKFCLGK